MALPQASTPVKPKIPAPLLQKLKSADQPPPWKCRLLLRRGQMLFNVEITAKGEISSVGGRAIFTVADLSFGVAAIVDVTLE